MKRSKTKKKKTKKFEGKAYKKSLAKEGKENFGVYLWLNK